MKIIGTLLATALLLAGCGGSSDDAPAPDVSRTLDRDQLDQQAQEQADQTKAAQDELAEQVEKEADEKRLGTVVDVTIAGGKVTPQGGRVEVTAGQPVTLRITSDADEEIHVHSDPEHSYEVGPGDTVDKTFTIDTPGQVAVEAHGLDVTIVQLVVRS